MAPPETTSPAAEAFFDKALSRIRKFLLVLAAIGMVICAIFFRWPTTAGFLAGAIISYVNQHWLEQAVEALGERIANGQSRERGGIIVVRAVLRYAMIAAGAYVIFNVSVAALYGFLGGVCLPIAAVACEVALEIVVSLRRRF
jgi:hypothetical protein